MATRIMVYTRIRLMSEVDIIELASLIAENKDIIDFMRDFTDVQTTPFDDDVPSMTAEQLKECLDCIRIEGK